MKWQATLMDCDACGYEWAAVHPEVTEYLECPVCHHMTPAPHIDPTAPMKAPKINLSELTPVFGWQEQNEIVYLRCPRGHVAQLDHGIDEQGIVSPSVQCPKCDFHESNLQLEGYSASDPDQRPGEQPKT